MRIVGKRFGTAAQPVSTYSESGNQSFTVTDTYRTLWNGWLGAAPGIGSAHPTYPRAILDTRDAKQITPGYLCDVTLTYLAPEILSPDVDPEDEENPDGTPPEPGAVLPPDEYTESANDVEYPIEAHPNFASFATEANGAKFKWVPPVNGLAGYNDFTGWTTTSPFSGYLTYKVGSVTESVTKYYWGKPHSVASDVGKRSGNWLTVSGSISRRGIYWSRTINRIYSTKGWNSTVYPN